MRQQNYHISKLITILSAVFESLHADRRRAPRGKCTDKPAVFFFFASESTGTSKCDSQM